MSFIVQAQGISKTFAAPAGGRLHALREVSLQARAGQLTALVGPDGAGKTTLMRLLAALLILLAFGVLAAWAWDRSDADHQAAVVAPNSTHVLDAPATSAH